MKFGMPKLHSSNSNFIPENAQNAETLYSKGFQRYLFFLRIN